MIDLALDREIDIYFEYGDIVTTDNIETSIVTAIYSYLDDIGVSYEGDGSLYYTLEQSRLTTIVIIELEDIIRKALEFLVDSGEIRDLTVKISVNPLQYKVTCKRYRKQEEYIYDL